MVNIIVAFPGVQDGKKLKNLLTRSGFQVSAICTNGANAIHLADGLVNGIMISAYRLPDMLYSEMKACIPPGFEMLVLAPQSQLADCMDENILSLPMPFAVRDLIGVLNQLSGVVELRKKNSRQKPAKRDEGQLKFIGQAKAMLMQQKHLSEPEAHRYLQRVSMQNGTGMAEAAQMLLDIRCRV